MFSKVLAFGAILAAANAGLLQNHGQIVSSHSVVHHEQPHIVPQHYAAASLDHQDSYTSQLHGSEASYDNHDLHAHPKYEYTYSVADPHTGDHKSQHESRDGDVVHGYYNLVQPDGIVREVKYTADDHNGFNAVVYNSAPSAHPESSYGHGY